MGAENDVWNRAGIGNVGSYQVAGYPWMSGSSVPDATLGDQEVQLVLPLVGKSFQIFSYTAEELRVHFVTLSAGNVYGGGHYLTLPSGSMRELPCKAKEIFVSAPSGSGGGAFEVFAELTGINKDQMPILTGSGHTD